jgi:hypothetical protein
LDSLANWAETVSALMIDRPAGSPGVSIPELSVFCKRTVYCGRPFRGLRRIARILGSSRLFSDFAVAHGGEVERETGFEPATSTWQKEKALRDVPGSMIYTPAGGDPFAILSFVRPMTFSNALSAKTTARP